MIKMKKIISILLSVCLLSGIMLLPVSANTTPIATGADGKVELTYYGGIDTATPTFATLQRGVTKRFCDRNNCAGMSTDLPEFLEDTTYYQPSFTAREAENYKDVKTTYTTFKLYQSATVYYITQVNSVNDNYAQCYIKEWNNYTNAGWVKSTASGYEVTTNNADATMWNAESGQSVDRNSVYIFKFDITASQDAPYTLNIGGIGKYSSGSRLNGPYSLAFDWKTEDEESVA